jgi:hypothetical protein
VTLHLPAVLDPLDDGAGTIASSVLRAAGKSAAAVRFVGVIDDFIALSASGGYSGGGTALRPDARRHVARAAAGAARRAPDGAPDPSQLLQDDGTRATEHHISEGFRCRSSWCIL